jgi:hypothetical protein
MGLKFDEKCVNFFYTLGLVLQTPFLNLRIQHLMNPKKKKQNFNFINGDIL